MSNRDAALRAAQQIIDRAERNKREGVFPCSSCRFSRIGFVERYCVHPLVLVAQKNCNDAFARDQLNTCSNQREAGGRSLWGPAICGPGGEFFEQKGGFLSRIFGDG